MKPPVWVMGDVHGHYERLVALLRAESLLNSQLRWAGDSSTLVFMGDFFDRGPDGIGVVELVMRLQKEAGAAGGEVLALLGNHELTILSARHFGRQHFTFENWSGDFYSSWIRNGGRESDLARLTESHISWVSALPAMLLVEERRFVHADAPLYYAFGESAPEVNKNLRAALRRRDPSEWNDLLSGFDGRDEFADSKPEGRANALRFLAQYGGYQIVHGHTPIPKMTGQAYGSVREALVYAGGLCVNVDGGIYHGGPGFLYRLQEL